MVRICILVSILGTCTGSVLASGTCQSETCAEDVILLQGRHAVRKHAQPEPRFEEEGLNEEWYNELEEWLNEEMPELPPVPVGYTERVREWVDENPSATAVLRQAIREQLIEVMQIRGPEEFRRFSRDIPRAANAMLWWSENNRDQAGRLAEIVAGISEAEDWGAAALHDWAASNPGFAAALRGVTRARLLHVIFEAARNNPTEEGDDRQRFPRATGQIRRWTRHNPYTVEDIFDRISGLQVEESLLTRATNEEPVEGTQGASTPLDFDSEDGAATWQQEDAVVRDEDPPSRELVEECAAHRRTRGTCFFSDCYNWRGFTQCVRGRCVCLPGQCSASSPRLGRGGFCTDPFEWQRLQLL